MIGKPKGLRIMIVEDDDINATLLVEVLEDMGHTVCAVESTEAGAVSAALRCKPDLMIVDALLAVGSGVIAVAEILRTAPVPHVFVTGDISRLAGIRPRPVSLNKPFRIGDLERAIERAIIIGIAPN